MRRLLWIFAALLLAVVASANEGGGHEEHAGGIPTVVFYQIFNFVLYAGILIFLLRKKIAGHFRDRQQNFRQALVRAQAAQNEAEANKRDIQMRLAKQQAGETDSVGRAHAEAEELRRRILEEAELAARGLREEAHRTAQLEIERAKQELRAELVQEAMNIARRQWSEKMADNDQRRLQSEFVDKIQVVRT